MKVLQINAVYGYSSTGVIAKHIRDYSERCGIETYVAFPKGRGRKEDNIFEIGSDLDHMVHAALSRIAGRQGYFSHFATKRLLDYIGRLKPDIVHLHNLHSNYINLNMLLKYLAENDIATVVTMHDCWYFTGGCFHYANRQCYKWQSGCGKCPKKMQDSKAYLFDASAGILKDRGKYLNAIPRLVMVGCSEWIANECRRSIIKNRDIRYIHNGFDFKTFQTKESEWRKKLDVEDKFVVLGAAGKWLSAVNKETYDYFVSNMPDDMVLVLFGCRNIDEEMPGNVRQIGYVGNPVKMAEIYSMADVMANCSREDTFSSINIEAQACGTPVVTYDATGNKETVLDINSVATGDFKALLKRIIEIRDNRTPALSEECINFVRSRFDRDKCYSNYISLYTELANG